MLFALASMGLFALVRTAVAHYAENTARTELLAEVALLRSEGQLHGTEGLRQLIARREHIFSARAFSYRLTSGNGRFLAGELPRNAETVGWGRIRVLQPDETGGDAGEQTRVDTLGARLADGSLLVVGRSAYDLEELAEWLDWLALWSGAAVTLLALGGGYLIAAVFLRRLERVNDATQRIMAGRLDARVPAIGMGEEFARLTANLNRMLDRNQALMSGLRRVSTNIAHDLRTPLTRLRHHLDSASQLQTRRGQG